MARDYKGFGNQGMTGVRVPKIKQYPRGKNKGGIKGQDGKTPSMTSSSWQNNNHLTYDEGYLETFVGCRVLAFKVYQTITAKA